MATSEATRIAAPSAVEPMRIVLHDVPWSTYTTLRDTEANDHIRLTYLDGTLELMSPEFIHERDSDRLDTIIRAVARAFRIPYQGAGSTTLRRRRRGTNKGQGREADSSFFFRDHAEHMASKTTIDLAIDPPPDLAIEVDHTAQSEWKLPVFARLGVPEVWRFDVAAGTLWFGRLQPDRTYSPIERSEALPMLTPAWVLGVLARGQGLIDSRWEAMLDGWVRDELTPPA